MRSLLALATLLLLAGPAAAQPTVVVEDPWVREAPPGTPVNAGYMVLRNDSERDARIVSVEADGFRRAEMHETIEEDGNTQMRPLDSLNIPAGGSVALEPGGRHLMLRDPDRRVTEGDWVTLYLYLENGALIEVTAQVRQRTGRSQEGSEA